MIRGIWFFWFYYNHKKSSCQVKLHNILCLKTILAQNDTIYCAFWKVWNLLLLIWIDFYHHDLPISAVYRKGLYENSCRFPVRSVWIPLKTGMLWSCLYLTEAASSSWVAVQERTATTKKPVFSVLFDLLVAVVAVKWIPFPHSIHICISFRIPFLKKLVQKFIVLLQLLPGPVKSLWCGFFCR